MFINGAKVVIAEENSDGTWSKVFSNGLKAVGGELGGGGLEEKFDASNVFQQALLFKAEAFALKLVLKLLFAEHEVLGVFICFCRSLQCVVGWIRARG